MAVLVVVLAGAMPAQAIDADACTNSVALLAAPDVPDVEVAAPAAAPAVQVSALDQACRGRHHIALPILPACSDGLDDDGDGAPDFPGDPGCQGPLDDSERPECSDHLDNDQDAHTDYPYDPECESPDDPSETACGPANPLDCGSAGTAGSGACLASPAPPLLVDAEWIGDAVYLEWQPAPVTPTAYLIYRAQSEGFNVEALTEPLAGVAGTTLSYTDATASGAETYVYWVTSASAGCESPPSAPAPVGPGIPDTSDCVFLRIGSPDPPWVEPEYRGTGCLTP